MSIDGQGFRHYRADEVSLILAHVGSCHCTRHALTDAKVIDARCISAYVVPTPSVPDEQIVRALTGPDEQSS